MYASSTVAERLQNLRRYTQELRSQCRCEELVEDDPCGALCPSCEDKKVKKPAARAMRTAAQEAKSPAPAPPSPPHRYQEQIAFIGEQLKACEAADGVEAKVVIVEKLYTYLLDQHAFLAQCPKFRKETVRKAAQFFCDPNAKRLVPLFGRFSEIVLYELPHRADWKA